MPSLRSNSMDIDNNDLLNGLSKKDKNLLMPYMHTIPLKMGMVLYEPGDEVKYAYFPCDSTLVSFVVLLDEARGVETALIGREGAVGGIVSEGQLPAYCRAVVHFPGVAIRIESAQLEEAKTRSPVLRHYFARYADCLLAQIFQSVACNATHTIEQRTARWLLSAHMRTGDRIVPLAQEELAGMLGVGRSYVARVIGHMKERGVVETMRGKLRINDLKALMRISCNCDKPVRQHFSNVLKFNSPREA